MLVGATSPASRTAGLANAMNKPPSARALTDAERVARMNAYSLHALAKNTRDMAFAAQLKFAKAITEEDPTAGPRAPYEEDSGPVYRSLGAGDAVVAAAAHRGSTMAQASEIRTIEVAMMHLYHTPPDAHLPKRFEEVSKWVDAVGSLRTEIDAEGIKHTLQNSDNAIDGMGHKHPDAWIGFLMVLQAKNIADRLCEIIDCAAAEATNNALDGSSTDAHVCPICYDLIDETERNVGRCANPTHPHKFCACCLDTWKAHQGRRATCPLCRGDLCQPMDVSMDEEVDEDEGPRYRSLGATRWRCPPAPFYRSAD